MRVVVTGAASGIGLATAKALAAAGAEVVMIDRDGARLNGAASAFEGRALVADVTDEAAVAAAFEAAGVFDGAVNCAGVLGPRDSAVTLPIEAVRRIFSVNVFGLFSCLQAELGHMVPRRRGVIVNVASAAGLVGARGLAGYSASKHAVIGLTRSAAADHAAHGVRINAVCPGVVRTPMAEELVPREESHRLALGHPIERIAEPQEVAAAILWLLSDAASFVTGAAVPVDGGYTAI